MTPKQNEQIDGWTAYLHDSFEWSKWLISRVDYSLRSGQTIYVHGEVGDKTSQVLIRVRLDFRDRLYHWWQSVLDGNFGTKSAPIWLREWEWFPLLEVQDVRGAFQESIFVDGPDLVPVIGTGLHCLNEFDIERAVGLYFKREGLDLDVTFKDFPTDLT